MDFFQYLTITDSDQQKYASTIEAIKLFPKVKSSYSFVVGTQKQSLQGDPSHMMINSELIRSMMPIILEEKSTELAKDITLTDENLPGFVVVWLLMNDLYPFEVPSDLKSLLIIWEWIW